MTKNFFKNREEAAKILSKKLAQYKNCNGIVLAIPRGGVVIGYYVAKNLNLPLNILLVKKISSPSNPEYALGAVFQDGTTIINPGALKYKFSETYFEEEKIKQLQKMKETLKLYNLEEKTLDLKNKIVFLTDDGIATGSTILVAAQSLKFKNTQKIIIAIPVAPLDTLTRLQNKVDEVVCVLAPQDFMAVGQFYDDFIQISDEEVKNYLKLSKEVM